MDRFIRRRRLLLNSQQQQTKEEVSFMLLSKRLQLAGNEDICATWLTPGTLSGCINGVSHVPRLASVMGVDSPAGALHIFRKCKRTVQNAGHSCWTTASTWWRRKFFFFFFFCVCDSQTKLFFLAVVLGLLDHQQKRKGKYYFCFYTARVNPTKKKKSCWASFSCAPVISSFFGVNATTAENKWRA